MNGILKIVAIAMVAMMVVVPASAGSWIGSVDILATFEGNVAPTVTGVSVTSPTDNPITELTDDITIDATVGDSDGTISSVTYAIDGGSDVAMSNDGDGTYSATIGSADIGTYSVTVTAIDDDGDSTTSSPATSFTVIDSTGLFTVSDLDFGTISYGATSAVGTFTVTNNAGVIVNSVTTVPEVIEMSDGSTIPTSAIKYETETVGTVTTVTVTVDLSAVSVIAGDIAAGQNWDVIVNW